MSAATNAALAARAVGTADLLEYWLKLLAQELEKQGIKYEARYPRDKTVTVSLEILSNVMLGMEDRVAEIRRFKPPKRAPR